MEMICVTVRIYDGALTHRVRVTAASIERALKLAEAGKPGRRVQVDFPIDPEAFFAFASSDSDQRAVA
jgi:hypothetical protein